MVATSTVRICLDCGRDDLARKDDALTRCPDCDSLAIR
jgi:DNA-directed RNA polymerase subunit RPC12/RpoP